MDSPQEALSKRGLFNQSLSLWRAVHVYSSYWSQLKAAGSNWTDFRWTVVDVKNLDGIVFLASAVAAAAAAATILLLAAACCTSVACCCLLLLVAAVVCCVLLLGPN